MKKKSAVPGNVSELKNPKTVALPCQIIDQLRAERGEIVDTAIEMGRIVVREGCASPRQFKSTGEILTVDEMAIKCFLKVIPEPEWIEEKKRRGEIIIKPQEGFGKPMRISREDVLWLCRIHMPGNIKELVMVGQFVIDPPLQQLH